MRLNDITIQICPKNITGYRKVLYQAAKSILTGKYGQIGENLEASLAVVSGNSNVKIFNFSKKDNILQNGPYDIFFVNGNPASIEDLMLAHSAVVTAGVLVFPYETFLAEDYVDFLNPRDFKIIDDTCLAIK